MFDSSDCLALWQLRCLETGQRNKNARCRSVFLDVATIAMQSERAGDPFLYILHCFSCHPDDELINMVVPAPGTYVTGIIQQFFPMARPFHWAGHLYFHWSCLALPNFKHSHAFLACIPTRKISSINFVNAKWCYQILDMKWI